MNRIITLLVLVVFTSCSSLYRTLKLAPSNTLKEVSFEEKNINPTYQFYYPDTTQNEYLRQLRVNYGLEELAANHQDEFEKIKALLNWTHQQWTHSGSNTPSKFDAITILEEAKKGNKFRCVEYGIVSAAALNSIGIPARVLALKTADVEQVRYGAGHVVAEAYSQKFGKWLFIDGQYNTIPVLENRPLNAVEFQKAITENSEQLTLINHQGEVSIEEKEQYINWISKYLYYFDTRFDNRNMPAKDRVKVGDKSKLMLVPLNAQNPSIFQKKDKIDYCVYSNNVNDFYQLPE